MNTAILIGLLLFLIIVFILLGVIGEGLFIVWKVFGFFMDILIHGFFFIMGIGIIGIIGYFLYTKMLS